MEQWWNKLLDRFTSKDTTEADLTVGMGFKLQLCGNHLVQQTQHSVKQGTNKDEDAAPALIRVCDVTVPWKSESGIQMIHTQVMPDKMRDKVLSEFLSWQSLQLRQPNTGFKAQEKNAFTNK